jgi:hypothetical protein
MKPATPLNIFFDFKVAVGTVFDNSKKDARNCPNAVSSLQVT